MIKCKNCPHLEMKFNSTEHSIVFGSTCNKYGVMSGSPEALKAVVISEHGKPCKYAK